MVKLDLAYWFGPLGRPNLVWEQTLPAHTPTQYLILSLPALNKSSLSHTAHKHAACPARDSPAAAVPPSSTAAPGPLQRRRWSMLVCATVRCNLHRLDLILEVPLARPRPCCDVARLPGNPSPHSTARLLAAGSISDSTAPLTMETLCRGPASNQPPRLRHQSVVVPSPVKLPKSVFTTVDQLKPVTQGNNLAGHVLSAHTLLGKPSPPAAAPCPDDAVLAEQESKEENQ